MDHLPPEGEPDAARARIEFFRGQRRLNDGLHALARAARRAQTRGESAGETRGEAAQRRLEQTVLVGEIVGDEAGRDARLLPDEGERRRGEALGRHRIDGRLDQLAAAEILGFDAFHGLAAVD